jgi:hypothetical protein
MDAAKLGRTTTVGGNVPSCVTSCALFVGLGFASATAAIEFTPDEQAVWQMEETYWRSVQAGDVEA